jgi:hypothetical protein
MLSKINAKSTQTDPKQALLELLHTYCLELPLTYNTNMGLFSNLPMEIMKHILSFVTPFSLNQLFRPNNGTYHFFKPVLIEAKKIQSERLLDCVLRANSEEAKRFTLCMNDQSPALIKVNGIEENTRSWHGISALEYATWAGDTELINLLLETVPEAQKLEALNQLEGVLNNGLEGQAYLGPYFSLIKAYNKYEIKYDQWNQAERDHYWVKIIGNCQLKLALVGLQQMCDPQPFDPIPSFDKSPVRTLQLSSGISLLPFDESNLSEMFALIKGMQREDGRRLVRSDGRQMRTGPLPWVVRSDRLAFSELCEVKAKELKMIIRQLNEAYFPAQNKI